MPDDTTDVQDRHDRISKLINTGVEIAGGAIGGALGFLAGGPVGVAAAALRHIGEEVSKRGSKCESEAFWQ
jgi:hypothetical protein